MQRLFGREREIHLLDDLIDHVNERGAALVVHGEAGVGKSALLASASARAQAHGMICLTTIGVQSEAHLPFAGLHQLLRPILAEVGELPDPQRDALLAAFGMITATAAPDLFLIALAALDLLAGAAARTPLLVIAEDAHWLDDSTCDVLTFIARRLESDPIILLIAIRDGSESTLAEAGLPTLHLQGLDEQAAGALLDAHTPHLAATVRQRLLAEAKGNPLALVELPAGLRVEQLGGSALLPELLPLTARLERAFGERIAQLPDTTRTLLLVASIDEGGFVAEVLSAAAIVDGAVKTEEALGPAIAAGLIVADDITLRFRHPLVRSAICQATTVTRQRTAHAALATVLASQPDRSVWHRAAAVMGPDEEVASELEAVAERAQHRGALAVAVAALERASQITDDSRRQGVQLMRAADMAFELGRRDLAMRLLHKVKPVELDPKERSQLSWLIEVLAGEGMWSGSAQAASFVAIADQARQDGDVALALNSLMMVAFRCYWSNPDQATRDLVVAAAERIPVPQDNPVLIAILALAAPIERGATVIDRIARLPQDGSGGPDMAHLLGTAASAVGDFMTAARLLSIGIAGVRRQGRLGLLAQILSTQAWTTFYSGDWNVAMPAAEESGRLARETGQPMWAATAQLIEARLAALRGELTLAEALVSAAEQVLLPMGANPLLALVQLARGLASLSEGRYATAYEQLRRMFDPTDITYHPITRCWAVADLVEAAVHSGQVVEARAAVAELEPVAAKMQSPYLQVSLHYAQVLLADDDTAEALFLTALNTELIQWPIARARLLLAYGAWLRRQRRVGESRAPLRAAREAFDALGAIPWGERARQELRASGETSRRRTPEARDQLSPQELQIAQMAADGLSNREIGQRLYLSHRTVGFHLYRIFPKLAITSRSELRAALSSATDLE